MLVEDMDYKQLKEYLESLNIRTTGLFTKKELLDKYYKLLHQYNNIINNNSNTTKSKLNNPRIIYE